jgi:hypothetical protein
MPTACLADTNFLDFRSKKRDVYIKNIPHGIAEYPKKREIWLNKSECDIKNGDIATVKPPTKSIVPKSILLSLLFIVSFSLFFLRGIYEYIIGYYRGVFKGVYFLFIKHL